MPNKVFPTTTKTSIDQVFGRFFCFFEIPPYLHPGSQHLISLIDWPLNAMDASAIIDAGEDKGELRKKAPEGRRPRAPGPGPRAPGRAQCRPMHTNLKGPACSNRLALLEDSYLAGGSGSGPAFALLFAPVILGSKFHFAEVIGGLGGPDHLSVAWPVR